MEVETWSRVRLLYNEEKPCIRGIPFNYHDLWINDGHVGRSYRLGVIVPQLGLSEGGGGTSRYYAEQAWLAAISGPHTTKKYIHQNYDKDFPEAQYGPFGSPVIIKANELPAINDQRVHDNFSILQGKPLWD